MRVRIACLAVSLCLCGCATNMAPVGTFGVATQGLSDQTTQVLSRYRGFCRERADLVRWELGAMQSAQGWWQSTPGSERETHLRDLGQQVAILQGALRAFDQNCPEQEALLDMVPRLSLVLSEYAKALQQLASDSFVTYDGKLKIGDAIGKLPLGGSGHAMLDDRQTDAVNGLADLIFRMATLSYRQKKLDEALNDHARADFRTIADKLADLTNTYQDGIEGEAVMLRAFSSDLSAALGRHDIPEPVAVSELKVKLDARAGELDRLRQAFPAYRQALAQMDQAFAAAAESVHHPTQAAVAGAIIDFSASAYQAEQALRDAFQER